MLSIAFSCFEDRFSQLYIYIRFVSGLNSSCQIQKLSIIHEYKCFSTLPWHFILIIHRNRMRIYAKFYLTSEYRTTFGLKWPCIPYLPSNLIFGSITKYVHMSANKHSRFGFHKNLLCINIFASHAFMCISLSVSRGISRMSALYI